MRSRKLKIQLVFYVLYLAIGILGARAQSTSVDFPMPLKSPEIGGTIPARDLGDARLTTFYYTFNGTQGDVFINIETTNFNGDVDVFIAEGLRPLAKITVYADAARSETGRVLYLRKPEKMILRVEGRTPDDRPANFKVKFAGSFAPSLADAETAEQQSALPEVKAEDGGAVRVNSVGTIIKDEIKIKDKSKHEDKTVGEVTTPPASDEENTQNAAEKTSKTRNAAAKNKPKTIASDNAETSKTDENVSEKKDNADASENKAESSGDAGLGRSRNVSKNARTKRSAANKTAKTESADSAAAADPLENVNLIVLLKNGDRLEYPMKQVFRFSLSSGVLTIVTKDGKIERRPITEVQRMTVE